MARMIPLAFRVDSSTKEKAESLAVDSDLDTAELLRFALAAGLSVVESVESEKREELTLSQAMTIHAVGMDYK